MDSCIQWRLLKVILRYELVDVSNYLYAAINPNRDSILLEIPMCAYLQDALLLDFAQALQFFWNRDNMP